MAYQKGRTPTLARCEFQVNGIPIAIVFGFSYSRQLMVSDVRTNQLERNEGVVNGVSHTISAQLVVNLGEGMIEAGLLPSLAGTEEQQLTAAIAAAGGAFTVWDQIEEVKVCDCYGVTPQSYAANIPLGSHATGSWSASCDKVRLHGEQ